MSNVYIIVLNWNGWKDTVQCLESLFRSEFPNIRVVVCDNQSTDGSVEKIQQWADGNLTTAGNVIAELEPLVSPPIPKPLPYVFYNQAEAETGGNANDEEIPLVIIQNNTNGGYSSGNNVGIRYAMHKASQYVWLLNNDTIVPPDTINQLVCRQQTNLEEGLTGSVICYATQPKIIQTYGGGALIPFLGIDRFVREPGPIAYVSGTSLFLRREVVEQIGYLDDGFFFYWEDVDYSKRAIKKGWKIGVAENTTVYHKFSASVKGQSLKSDLFKVASLTHYYKKHYKIQWIIPVFVNLFGMVAKRIYRFQFDRIKPILQEMINAINRK